MPADHSFSDPNLEGIHNSIVRMQKKVDSLISVILAFLLTSKNWRETMQIKEEKKPKASYKNAIHHLSFSKLEHPVIDTQGNIREKGEEQITLGIYDRKPVEIIESADLRKVHEDYRSLEDKVEDLISLVKEMRIDLNKQRDELAECRATIAAQNKELAECRATIKQQDEKIKQQDEKIKQQDEVIKSQNEKFERQRVKTKKQKAEMTRIKNIVSEKESNEEIGCIPASYKPKLKIRIEEGENTKSPPFNAAIGFSDSVFYGFPCRTTKRNEEKLKTCAREGNVEAIRRIINANETDINGVGAPDSLCAIFSGDRDKTPLMIASESGNFETVKILLEGGANINLLDRNDKTALDYAANNDHGSICAFLKRKGGVGREPRPLNKLLQALQNKL